MLVGVQELPNRYRDTHQLSSLAHRSVVGVQSGSFKFAVGGSISISKEFYKYRVIEKYGNNYIERYFLSYGPIVKGRKNDDLIPIYLKVYSENRANVVLFSQGMTRAIRLAAIAPIDELGYKKFVHNVILQCALVELDTLSQELADDCRTAFLEARHVTNKVDNDRTIALHQHGAPCDPVLIANHIYSASQYSARMGIEQDYGVMEFLELSSPDFSDTLNRRLLDNLTERSVGGSIDYREILDTQLISPDRNMVLPALDEQSIKNSGFQQINNLSGALVELCTFLSNWNCTDLSVVYVTSNNQQRYSLKRLKAHNRHMSADPITSEELHHFLDLLDATDPIATMVTLEKTWGEELYIEFAYTQGAPKRIYLDLFFSTILTHSMANALQQ